ncbi:MAG: hypothetical protein JSU94_19545 [Phycisphaerales bacterium]|nr:MAG: hypothetical protein JSU94_19545 [Phycisphaerales bacterium]
MTGLRKFKIPLALVFLMFLVVFVGCNGVRTDTAGDGQDVTVAPAQRKADLQDELDRRFENPDAHFELGRLYHGEGLWERAGYHYGVALSFRPSHRRAQAAMVKVLLDSGDASGAQSRVQSYMKQAGGYTDGLLALGKAFSEQQLDTYALSCFQQALSLSPDSAEVNKEVGYYYLSRKNTDAAKQYLSRSFQLDPTQADVALELGRLGIQVRIPRPPVEDTGGADEGAEEPGEGGQ